ncbi:leucine-rich repeat-containing G-protein coupled receptor 5A-like [Ornithodoros turicata]|uniref:leucine-rich repeat-containing G-protein coupled receptor 5A-like n=1 Tax=Ornithodoros turicata TaxID=34597 RepID=UPI003139CE36
MTSRANRAGRRPAAGVARCVCVRVCVVSDACSLCSASHVMLPWSVLFLLVTLLPRATRSSGEHPCGSAVLSCRCSGPPDVLKLDCSASGLSQVPAGRPDLAVVALDLSRNNLSSLEEDAFDNYSHLEELRLDYNDLEWLPPLVFTPLVKLTFLSVEGNNITESPSEALQHLTVLETLHLNKNRLQSLGNNWAPLRRLRKMWLDGNLLAGVPTDCLNALPNLQALGIAENRIDHLPAAAFGNASKLEVLILRKNEIRNIDPDAFRGLRSLQAVDLSYNRLMDLPEALSTLPSLKELIVSDNEIRFLTGDAFRFNAGLTLLELANNPLESFHKDTFAHLPQLKRLMVKEVPGLKEFPNLNGTHSLEQIRLSRAQLGSVPADLCRTVPKLKMLYLMSNQLTSVPDLTNCSHLLLLDLTYNRIHSLEGRPFQGLSKLRDLNLGNNLIRRVNVDSFQGLSSLQVLALQKNEIFEVHPDAFLVTTKLQDLNLADNVFPVMPYRGLRGLHRLTTSGNRFLRDFPPPEVFPHIQKLYLSYSYHCCVYRHKETEEPVVKDAVLWLNKEDVDMDTWTTNMSAPDFFPDNISSKFQEFTHQLIKVFGQDYIIPDNLAQYYGEYLEDYKALYNADDEVQYPVQCIPHPTPFLPCEDLFGWWTLRCGVWVVFLLAMLGNGLVVVVLSLGRSKMDVPRFLVCNLALADFFMGVYLGFLAVVDASTLGEFRVYGIWWQLSAGCQVAGFLGVFSSELSVYTLSVITMERNYAITHAMHLNKRLSLKHAGYIMSIGWTFALIMAILPLVGVSDYRKFAVCLPFETETSAASFAYVIFLILINGVAFLILMGCYLKMYCAIRGSQAWNSNDSRIAKRMALLVFTDFLCWAPIAFFSLTALSGVQLVSLEEAKVFTIFVLPLNSCANPFLYAIFTKQFKRDCVLICKRIEESRVTRGIGRCRHSSNFSNRHTLLGNTNSAGERVTDQPQCQCGVPKTITPGWKSLAARYLLCRDTGDSRTSTDAAAYSYALARIQRAVDRGGGQRNSSISSENFSSRSDSWRQGNMPLRLLLGRGNTAGRKASHDSSLSCSRQDSSTSTMRMSRSSVSSDGSKPPARVAAEAPARSLRGKPQLCRQLAMDDVAGRVPRSPPRRQQLCPACCRRDPLKSKEFDEKFNCFYNRLAETSREDSSELSKDDPAILSTDQSDNRNSGKDETTNTSVQSDAPVPPPPPPPPPRRPQKRMHISVDDICSERRERRHSSRKVASDNSLKKLSLRNLPLFLRSLSSQSPRRLKVSSQGHLESRASEGLPCSKSDTRIHHPDYPEWSQLEPIPHGGSDADRSASDNDDVFLEFRARDSSPPSRPANSVCVQAVVTSPTEDDPLLELEQRGMNV